MDDVQIQAGDLVAYRGDEEIGLVIGRSDPDPGAECWDILWSLGPPEVVGICSDLLKVITTKNYVK